MQATAERPPETLTRRVGSHRAKRKKRSRTVILALCVLSMVTGLTLVGGMALAPETMDALTGNAKVGLEKQIHALVAPDELPEITLGAAGGMRELNSCDNTFTEMTSYRVPHVLPLYAAHNNCGGDIILGWAIGQRVRVTGSDIIYEVVEERHTPKWSKVEILRGMKGEFMVQTCFYGQNLMRFLSLAPVTPQPPAAP